MIGYVIDLDRRTLSIAKKNCLNIVYGFSNATAHTTLLFAQIVASWASRYSMIFGHTRPFSSSLHHATCGRSNKKIKFKYRPEAQRSIRMWRATLALVELNEAQFTRSLDSFQSNDVPFIVEFDASLKEIGLLRYTRDKCNIEKAIWASAVDISSMNFGDDSSFQNVAEYTGGLMGLVGLKRFADRAVLGIKRKVERKVSLQCSDRVLTTLH